MLQVGSVVVTGKIQTAVDLALRYDVPWAVAVMDRLLNTAPLISERRAATVDFYWKAAGVVGEFDGRTKYLNPAHLQGRTASQAVIDEKVREDRIRSTGLHVVRWLWETALSPVALERCLRAAGVPQNATPLVIW